MEREPVQRLFDCMAEKMPEQVAISCGETRVTYRELQQRTDKLAQLLIAGGARKGSIVAILLDNKVDAITSIVAVLKAGAVFVPFDPMLPDLRLETMVSEVTPDWFLSEANLMQRLNGFSRGRLLSLDQLAVDDVLASPAAEPAAPDDFCYVYFTSGSTGRPKCIAGRLKGIDHFIRWQIETLGIGKDDRVSQLLPLSFDGSLRDIFAPLCAGGTICVPEHHEIVTDAKELVAWLNREAISLIHCVPTLFRALLNEELHAEQFRALRYVLLAGEALLPSDVGRWREVFGDRVKLINLYGTSETTMAKFIYEVQPGDEKRRSVPVGKPMPGARALIVDEDGSICRPGAIGEIYIDTPYRSHGYYKQPELTAEVFIANPFSNDPNDIVYRTGDLGRLLDDGNLELLGRKDQQVKIRGVRVELEEINSLVRGFTGVQDVAVIDRKDTSGGHFLCAYLVGDGQFKLDALREYLHERLPGSMVPSAYVLMERLPRTMSGKIDRRALPQLKDRTGRREYVPPRSATEQMLAEIWANILGLPQISLHDDFFELGGHSLLATQVMVRVRKATGVELPLRALFKNPTVAQLAAQIEAGLQKGAVSSAPPLVPVARDEELPLSFAQQRLWFLDQLQPGKATYNCPAAMRFVGTLNLAALAQSLNEVVRRHEVLRVRFSARDGSPVQINAPSLQVPLPLIDLSGLPRSRAEVEIERLSGLEAQRGFDLSKDELLRTKVLRVSVDEHVVLVTMHHIVSDGWSIGVLVKEVAALYQAYAKGSKAALGPLAVQYADYAHWEREWLQGEVLAEQLAYWKEQLAEAPVLELPADRPRPPMPSYRGAYESFELDVELSARLMSLSRRLDATLFMTLLAAWQALLHRYSGQSDIVVGTPIANRHQAETEELIGFFVNLLALRTDVSGNPTFAELVERVRETALEGYAHQALPFEKLVEELQPDRDTSHAPLVQVVFVLQNAPQGDLSTLDLKLSYVEVDTGTAKFDLVVNVYELGDGLSFAFTYSTDLFDAASMQRLGEHYKSLLAEVVENADKRVAELDLLSPAERRGLLVERNATAAVYPVDKCVHELFEEQVRRSPGAVALVSDGTEISYAELQRRAALLAAHLQERDLGPGSCVGIFLDHSIETVVAILGVLRVGAAYVPLDTDHPRTRLAFILEDARVETVLAQQSLIERLPLKDGLQVILVDSEDWQRVATEGHPYKASSADAAYVIYTSGSTGQPKGVKISHRALVNYLSWCRDVYVKNEEVSFALYSSLAFDLTVTSLFTPLLTGNRLIIYGPSDPFVVQRIVQDNLVDVLKLTPSHLALIKDLDNRNGRVKRLIAGGESLTTELAAQVHESFGGQVEILNEYGPTEATVGCMIYRFDPARDQRQSVPIGGPAANVQIHVLDQYLNPTPANVIGELYIAGDGLADCYLKRPELTAERFIPNPYVPGTRMYRSGDRARWLAQGAIEYLGRGDEQVKYHGYRIELSEISSALNQHPQVRNSVVLLRQNHRGEETLVAYYVARREIESTVLREFLRDHLIKETIPNVFVHLTRLPLTLNGKVDYQALPELQEAKQSKGEYVAPRTIMEEVVADLWSNLLGLERVSVDDNFFELGGHSLIATQVMARVRKTTSVELPLRALFENPTVAQLAAQIEVALRTGAVSSAPPLVPVARDGELQLSFAQQRLWFLDQLEPGSAFYNVPTAVRLQGPLDIEALERTLSEIVRRHEVLRTTFSSGEGQPVQMIGEAQPLRIAVEELSSLSEPEREQKARVLLEAEAQAPFDLSVGPLLRVRLLKLAAEEHILLLTMHHIISDGWSLGVLIREVDKLYAASIEGEPSPLPELAIQYADYAVWQREWLQGEVLEEELKYWREQLGGELPVLELPTDRARPEVQSYRGAQLSFSLSSSLSQGLQQLSERHGCTLFMTLLAAFQTLLYRHSGQEEIVVGSPIAGRNQTEMEQLIGFFVNTLVLRTDLSGRPSFRELLQRVREVTLGAYTHQEVPFEKLVEELQPERDLSRSPLFQVLFTLQNTPEKSDQVLPGVELEWLGSEGHSAKFELTLVMMQRGEVLEGTLDYNTDLFETETMERLLKHYQNLLQGVMENVDQRISELELLRAEERSQLVEEWNETVVEYPQLEKLLGQLSGLGTESVDAEWERPMANAQVYVLDKQQQLVPRGVKGELFVGGAAVARGYLAQADLTAERFVPDEYSGRAGARLYQTGDICWRRADGSLMFGGRIDDQLTLRGFRVDLFEIEATLKQHAGVREVVVVVRELKQRERQLLAYVVGETETPPTAGELRDHVRSNLPDHMVPAAFVFLSALPLSPNGKVDRRALPLPGKEPSRQKFPSAPLTELEQTISEVWCQVLQVDKVNVHDNFFDIGGHSLLMIQMHGILAEVLQKKISLVDMFKYPTVSSLAKYVEQNGHPQSISSLGPQKETLQAGKMRLQTLKLKQAAKLSR
jgi:amino acid adenylation domain-containing protein